MSFTRALPYDSMLRQHEKNESDHNLSAQVIKETEKHRFKILIHTSGSSFDLDH